MLQLAENLRKRDGARFVRGVDWRGRPLRTDRRCAPPSTGARHARPEGAARRRTRGRQWRNLARHLAPELVGPTGSSTMRVAPVAHAGELLGLIVVTRRPDGEPFTDTDHTVLTRSPARSRSRCTTCNSTRHCRRASTNCASATGSCSNRGPHRRGRRRRATQARTEPARRRAAASRRPRDPKLRLAHDDVDDDPADAKAMIDEIKGDVQTAIGAALTRPRHLPTLAGVERSGRRPALRRRSSRIADHGGNSTMSVATATTSKRRCTSACSKRCRTPASTPATPRRRPCGSLAGWVVALRDPDDGAGFVVDQAGQQGHGFVNMTDRLGAFGGTVSVVSAPGGGTTDHGHHPVAGPRTGPGRGVEVGRHGSRLVSTADRDPAAVRRVVHHGHRRRIRRRDRAHDRFGRPSHGHGSRPVRRGGLERARRDDHATQRRAPTDRRNRRPSRCHGREFVHVRVRRSR